MKVCQRHRMLTGRFDHSELETHDYRRHGDLWCRCWWGIPHDSDKSLVNGVRRTSVYTGRCIIKHHAHVSPRQTASAVIFLPSGLTPATNAALLAIMSQLCSAIMF